VPKPLLVTSAQGTSMEGSSGNHRFPVKAGYASAEARTFEVTEDHSASLRAVERFLDRASHRAGRPTP
jgi:hypothetical protein